jgi:integrase
MSEKKSPLSANKRKKRKSGEGTVYWDTRIKKYTAEVFDIHGKRRKARFDDEDSAHNWRSEQKQARQRGEGTFVRNPKETLGEYLIEWVGSRKGISRNTIRFYEQSIVKRINPYIGHLKVKNLNPKIIEDFITMLIEEKKYKGGTVRGVVRTLSKAFKDGVRWGYLPSNVMKNVELPEIVSIPSPRIPAKDVVKLRIESASNPYDAARLETGVAIGLRPGEVTGLKWKDFKAEERILRVERQIQRYKGIGLVEDWPKRKKIKEVPLLPHEVELFEALFKFQTSAGKLKRIVTQEDYIFPNQVGKAKDPTSDRKWFHRLCERAGIPKYQRFQMRKTAFTELNHVTDLATVKKYSGHTQISTLINHYIDPEQAEVVAALERRHNRNPETRVTYSG